MSTNRSNPAGVIRFDGAGEADWQANTSGLSGDWSDITHWTTGAVPDIETTVVISDDGAATSPWLVTETGESAASVLLDMTQGTLEATSALTVAGTLTQQLGALLVDAGALVSVAALEQTDGTLILNDDGTATTTLDSAGTDTVNGQVVLAAGAQWIDAALGIGLGLLGDNLPVDASVTLQGGAATGSLYVAGVLQVGGDPSSESVGGGLGWLDIDGGSNANVGGVDLQNGSEISVDVSSYMVVGSVDTAVLGAVNIGAGYDMLADVGTVNADLVNDGSLSIVAFQGDSTTAPGDLLVTGSLVNTGSVSVAAGATLAAGGSVELDAGSLSVGTGGVLDAGNAGSTGLYLAGGEMLLDGATLASAGTADFANSNAMLLDGARWTTSTLSIAPGYSDGTAAQAVVTLAGGSALSDAGGLNVGNDPGFGAAASTEPGGIGTLALSGASTVAASSLAVLNNSTLSLDDTSSVVLGTAAAEVGTVAVGADSVVFADIATIGANVDDAGTLDIAAFSDGSPGSTLVTGDLSGSGMVTVDGTLELGAATAFAGMISIAGGGTLILDSGDMPGAVIAANAAVATIDVQGQAFDSTAFTPIYDTNTGLLVFGDAASQSTLDLGAGLATDDILLFQNGSGTLITEAPCYVVGTLIQGVGRAVPVESLRPGDRVRTRSGRIAPVVWVGRREIDLRRHRQPWRAAPVRILAGAITPGVPGRDLLVSPDHALYLDGRLVPACRLANGATIARQDGLASVTYVHVELDRHDVILAENCPAESYLDTGNRGLFANAGGPHPLHPDLSGTPDPAALAVWAARGAAPLLLEGDALVALRERLLARARELGWAVTATVRPAVLADDTPLVVRPAGTGVWWVRLHQDTRQLRLRSASFVPAEMLPDSGDTRRLGLAVRALLVDGEPVQAEAYGAGWHAAEDGFRWSDGCGEILLPRRSRRATLEVLTEAAGQYWRPPRRRRAAAQPVVATR